MVGLACGVGVLLRRRWRFGWRGVAAAALAGIAVGMRSGWQGVAQLEGMALVGLASGVLVVAECRRPRVPFVVPFAVAAVELVALTPYGRAFVGIPEALAVAFAAMVATLLSARTQRHLWGRRWGIALLLRSPGAALGLLPILRAPASRLAAEAALAGSVLLGAKALIGGDPAGAAVAAGSLGLFSASLAAGASSAAALAESFLPVARGYVLRRGSIPVAGVAAAVFALWLWLSNSFSLIEVMVIAVGLGVATAGCGAVLCSLAGDLLARPVAGVAAVALPLLALAPFVQLNNAGFGPFATAYAVGGSSFAVLVGLSGVAIARWWRGT